MTIRDSYTLQQMDKCINLLRDMTIFSTWDAKRRHWYVEIPEEVRRRTPFTLDHGHSRFIVILIRLKNETGMIQRGIEILLTNVRWQFASFYLDYIDMEYTRRAHLSY